MILRKGVNYLSLYDLRPSEILVQQEFELKTTEQAYLGNMTLKRTKNYDHIENKML